MARIMRVRSPYLVQRASMNETLAPKTARLSGAVSFDYMGSSEFEFGALPKSFRRIEEHADAFVQRKVPEIKNGEEQLRVWSSFADEQFEEYKGHLITLRAGKGFLKEATHFEAGRKTNKWESTNFWWDIDNDAMFGFRKEFMNRVGDYVAASLTYMNEQAKLR